MEIIVASKNPVKINAVKELIPDYAILNKAKVNFVDINTEVSDQPKSLEETIRGAIKRAKKAFNEKYSYIFGIESGL